MCGGLAFQLSQIPKSELSQYFPENKIQKFEENGEGLTFYWDENPVLPVVIDNTAHLVEWGNRSGKDNLPRTGWAKLESINEGKWRYLNPKSIIIPAIRGYEKGVWFDINGQGLEGISVNKENIRRIYMVTKPASNDYIKLTKHNRQPIEVN